jgi:general stress protein 26
MDTLTRRDPKLRKLARLIGDIRFGVLTTIAEDGSLWSRPVSTQEANPDGELWFFAKRDSPLVTELQRHPRVSICYAKPIDCSYVSISGHSRVLSDRRKAAELWDPSYQAWLPGGASDPDLALIRVSVERAEYWDSPSESWPIEAGFTALAPAQRFDPACHAEIDMRDRISPVIVRTGPCPSCSMPHARCSHRSFPGALGVGETARQAAADLHQRLSIQKDTLEDCWHRDMVSAAIADVEIFLAEDPETPPTED